MTIDLTKAYRIVDCSHTIDSSIPIWPGGQRLEKKIFRTYEKDGYSKESFLMGDDLGTHMDSPAHFIKGKHTISDIAISNLICPAVVVDIEAKAAQNPDYTLTVGDMLQWEKQHGNIPTGALVCMKSGWFRKFSDEKKYQNMDDKGIMHFPAFSKAAAEFLVNERNINGIAVDTLSTDLGTATNANVHMVILGANKFQIENLDLSDVPAAGAIMIILPIKIKDAPEAETRVIALIQETLHGQ